MTDGSLRFVCAVVVGWDELEFLVAGFFAEIFDDVVANLVIHALVGRRG